MNRSVLHTVVLWTSWILLALAVSANAHPGRHEHHRGHAHPKGYRVLQVTTSTSEFSQFAPVINNRGEIIYLEQKTNVPGNILVSTVRGEVARSDNLGSQDLSNRGEVVWQDIIPGLGWHIFSSERGILGPGNIPRINRFGDVAVLRNVPDTEPRPFLIYRADGTTTLLEKDPSATSLQFLLGYSRRGLLYFATSFTPEYHGALYSTRRGLLFSYDAQFQGGPAGANGRGDVLNLKDGVLYLPNGKRITPAGPVFGADINDFWDVVFAEQVNADVGGSAQIEVLLATMRPDYYIRRFGFTYRDEDDQ
jgi:hypothetical protein